MKFKEDSAPAFWEKNGFIIDLDRYVSSWFSRSIETIFMYVANVSIYSYYRQALELYRNCFDEGTEKFRLCCANVITLCNQVGYDCMVEDGSNLTIIKSLQQKLDMLTEIETSKNSNRSQAIKAEISKIKSELKENLPELEIPFAEMIKESNILIDYLALKLKMENFLSSVYAVELSKMAILVRLNLLQRMEFILSYCLSGHAGGVNCLSEKFKISHKIQAEVKSENTPTCWIFGCTDKIIGVVNFGSEKIIQSWVSDDVPTCQKHIHYGKVKIDCYGITTSAHEILIRKSSAILNYVMKKHVSILYIITIFVIENIV